MTKDSTTGSSSDRTQAVDKAVGNAPSFRSSLQVGVSFMVLLAGCPSAGPGDGGVEFGADAGGDLAPMSDAGTFVSAEVRTLSATAANALLGETGVQEGTQVVDVRSAVAFAAGHVPGAIHLDTGGLRTTVDGVSGQVVTRGAAISVFETAGVDSAAHLIIVGAANDTNTSRALWTLAYFGAEGPLTLLDGGFNAWQNLGLEESTTVDPGVATWMGADTRQQLRVDKAWVLAHLDDASVALFDVRTAGEYEAGHIPGARQANWSDNINAAGLFNDQNMIRDHFGNPAAATLIVYCQSGARASVGWALLRSLGYQDVRLYDGSWNEWGADPDTPKVTGAGA